MKYYFKNGVVFHLESADESFTEISETDVMGLIKPSEFHVWKGAEWIDPRTPEEIAAYNRSIMPNLSPIEFEIKLYKAGLYDTVKNYIENEASVPVKIAYNRAMFFSRTDPFVTTAMRDLELTDEQVDAVWTGE